MDAQETLKKLLQQQDKAFEKLQKSNAAILAELQKPEEITLDPDWYISIRDPGRRAYYKNSEAGVFAIRDMLMAKTFSPSGVLPSRDLLENVRDQFLERDWLVALRKWLKKQLETPGTNSRRAYEVARSEFSVHTHNAAVVYSSLMFSTWRTLLSPTGWTDSVIAFTNNLREFENVVWDLGQIRDGFYAGSGQVVARLGSLTRSAVRLHGKLDASNCYLAYPARVLGDIATILENAQARGFYAQDPKAAKGCCTG